MQWSNGAARNPVAMSSLSPDLAVVLEPPDRGTDLVIKLENRGYGTVELAAVTVFLNSGTFGDGVPFGCTSSSENIVRCLFYGIGEGRVATWSLQLIPNEGVETVSLLAISKMGGDGVSNTVEDGDPANDQAELVVQAPKLRVIT